MNLLYLVHRLPYPPNKGDKISSFNILRHLSSRHDVYLGTFVDSSEDWQYVDVVRGYCKDLCVQRLNRRSARLRSLVGLLTGEPLSNVYYRNADLYAWVGKILEERRPDAVLIYSGCMAQFVYGRPLTNVRTVFDAEDVDSEKWSAYSAVKPWPFSWLYAREARHLREYECRMAKAFDVTVFISAAEAALFKSICPQAADRVISRTQGVDVKYFDPSQAYPNPYAPSDRALVFVGAMDYWPNVQGVVWFAKEIFPRIRALHADAKFYVVGTSPTDEIMQLRELDGIVVTGAVPDVRPYLKHSWAVCLPLMIARGIQNKALEAMAMAKRILASPDALAGIALSPSCNAFVCGSRDEWISSATNTLSSDRPHEPAAREFVESNFSWDTNLRRFEETVFGKRAV